MNDKYKYNFYLAPSGIHGTGLFANKSFTRGNIIGVAMHFFLFVPIITSELGQWINHSYVPNCKIHYYDKKNKYYLVALKEINKNDELTINYNDTPWYIRGPESHYK